MAYRHVTLLPLPPASQRPRRLAAAMLRLASIALGQLARRLGRAPRRRHESTPVLEFHAEAGAPEGALYIDGRLVGHLPGVQRL